LKTSRKILVVDDHPDTAQTFAALLETLGHYAEFVTDPRNALDAIRRLRPDAVFLDIEMPELNGYQLARMVKEEFQAITAVAITGHSSQEDRRKAREAGFDAHVTKPADLDMLQSILDTVLGPPSTA
jgi:CheY-like chemotaxis protein